MSENTTEETNSEPLVPRLIHYNFLAMILVAFFVGALVSFANSFITPAPESDSSPWLVMLAAFVAGFITTTGLSIVLERRNRAKQAAAELRIAEIIEDKYGWKIEPREVFRGTMDNQIEIPYRRVRAVTQNGQPTHVILSLSADGRDISAYRDPMSV